MPFFGFFSAVFADIRLSDRSIPIVQRRAVGVEHRVGILLIFALFHAKQI
jgi:hypothetical protein